MTDRPAPSPTAAPAADPGAGPGRAPILGFDRNLLAVGVVSFLTDTATKMVYSVMPLFLLSIGASKTTCR